MLQLEDVGTRLNEDANWKEDVKVSILRNVIQELLHIEDAYEMRTVLLLGWGNQKSLDSMAEKRPLANDLKLYWCEDKMFFWLDPKSSLLSLMGSPLTISNI